MITGDEHQRLTALTKVIEATRIIEAMGLNSMRRSLREAIFFVWETRHLSKFDTDRNWTPAAQQAWSQSKTKGVIYDHAVPLTMIISRLLELNGITPEAVYDILENEAEVWIISRKENANLDAHGLREKMPPEFHDQGHTYYQDKLARYKVAGIELGEKATLKQSGDLGNQMNYDLAYHLNRVEHALPEQRELVNELRDQIVSLGDVTETFHRDCIRYKVTGKKFCELHPKPRNGYLWIQVRRGEYPDVGRVFEDADYQLHQRRIKVQSKTEIPVAMKVIRHSFALAQ